MIKVILLGVVLILTFMIMKVNYKVAKEDMGKNGDDASMAYVAGIINSLILIGVIIWCIVGKKK